MNTVSNPSANYWFPAGDRTLYVFTGVSVEQIATVTLGWFIKDSTVLYRISKKKDFNVTLIPDVSIRL